MLFKRGKMFIMLFMLLTFIGQAVAYNLVPCNMHDSTPQITTDLTSIMSHGEAENLQADQGQDLAPHSHENMAQESCKNSCCCPMGSCVNLALSSATSTIDELLLGSHKISQGQSLLLSRYSSSLYRPPILS